MIRMISRKQVEELLNIEDAIDILERAFTDVSTGEAITPPRVKMDIPQHGSRQAAMMAFIKSCNGLGIKIYTILGLDDNHNTTTFTGNILLNDTRTGKLLTIMDGTYITEVRTAAASAVATKYLAREDSTTLAIIGSGKQGCSHLKALPLVRPIKHVQVFDQSEKSIDLFLHIASKELKGLQVDVFESAQDAVKDCDIVVTASSSTTPVVEFGWLKNGVHINAIGACTPLTREIDSATVAVAKVFVDSYSAVMSEAGDILIPISEGVINEDHIYAELGELINGSKPGRSSPDEITLFKSVGSAVLDVATAVVVYQRAVEKNIGTLVDDLQ